MTCISCYGFCIFFLGMFGRNLIFHIGENLNHGLKFSGSHVQKELKLNLTACSCHPFRKIKKGWERMEDQWDKKNTNTQKIPIANKVAFRSMNPEARLDGLAAPSSRCCCFSNQSAATIHLCNGDRKLIFINYFIQIQFFLKETSQLNSTPGESRQNHQLGANTMMKRTLST